jgi:hypothetical protein
VSALKPETGINAFLALLLQYNARDAIAARRLQKSG